MSFGGNTIEFRPVRRRVVEPGGGITWENSWQCRTKDTVITVLGVVSLGSWSAWRDIDIAGSAIYVDESGNQITP